MSSAFFRERDCPELSLSKENKTKSSCSFMKIPCAPSQIPNAVTLKMFSNVAFSYLDTNNFLSNSSF